MAWTGSTRILESAKVGTLSMIVVDRLCFRKVMSFYKYDDDSGGDTGRSQFHMDPLLLPVAVSVQELWRLFFIPELYCAPGHWKTFCNFINQLSIFFVSEFVNSNPVEGISDGTLQMTFLELRQVQLITCCNSVYLFFLLFRRSVLPSLTFSLLAGRFLFRKMNCFQSS